MRDTSSLRRGAGSANLVVTAGLGFCLILYFLLTLARGTTDLAASLMPVIPGLLLFMVGTVLE